MSLWHPFTQHKIEGSMINIARAQGTYLYRDDGTKIIDGIASWWINTHGHNHPAIVSAVQQQAAKLDQVIFAGFTHAPAEELAAKMLHATAQHFSKVFLSDSGSTSVEVALKMAIGYHAHRGQTRTKILALDHAYHGDTFGAMAAGARSIFNAMYSDFLFDVVRIPFIAGQGPCLQTLREILQSDSENIAAFIFEPLVLGAGGMMMYDAATLRSMMDLCKAHDVLSIADEVMTGFGRTGTMFACQQAGMWPDLLCLSKGLTGGFLPLGATLATQEIYDAFYDDHRSRMFFHSSSFSGNPLACAAANASLKIWRDEPVLERIAAIADTHRLAQKHFENEPLITHIRQCGTILALDIATTERDYLDPVGPRLYQFFLQHGILLRPLGNTVYILPPYCISRQDLETIYEHITLALRTIGHDGSQRAA